jgi:excisionase family DNA binding protein
LAIPELDEVKFFGQSQLFGAIAMDGFNHIKPDGWLTLSEAAHILGVHPSTVRSWANQGFLPVHRTSGGHRRFLDSEVELWMQSQRVVGPPDVHQVMQNALRTTRFHISEGKLKEEEWYNKLDEEARQQYRESGRSLLQGLMSSMSEDKETAGAAAEAVGYEYASRGRRCGLSAVEATHAFLFFRNVLLESMLAAYEAASIHSPKAWSDTFLGMTAFTDQILITLMETYEVYQRANP